MARLEAAEFPYRVALTCADPQWESEAVEATHPMPAEGPYRGFVRRTDAGGIRLAYFGGRTTWHDENDGHVTEGLLFEVSGNLKSELPKSYPSDGRHFHEIGEATVTDRPDLLPRLRKAYRP